MEAAVENAKPKATATAAGESAREARRRKILERGTDRLAFITGQARSIPPSTETALPPPPPTTTTQCSSSSETQRTVILTSNEKSELPKNETISENTRSTLDTTRDELFTKHERGNGAVVSDTTQDITNLVSKVTQITTDERAVAPRHLAPTTCQNLVSPVAQATPDNRVDDAPRHLAPTRYQSFSPKRISHCISSSENIRLLCAAIIAILVVLFNHGYGLGSQAVASLITFRPLYLVLLTNATIVLWLLLANQEPERPEEMQQHSGGEFDLAKALEVGLVVQQAIRAAFFDCSICALLMIIGIPFGAKGVV